MPTFVGALAVVVGVPYLVALGWWWLNAWLGLSPDHHYRTGPWWAPWL